MADTTTAETAYFAADEAAGHALEQLRCLQPAADRAVLLRELADAEERMSRACVAAWPEDETPDEDGFTPSQSMRLAAQALRHIADAEDPAVLKADPGEWADAAGRILDRLDGAASYEARVEALGELYTAVEPLIGGQAAEAIWAVRRAYTVAALGANEGI